jgi:hypothetical protein
MMKLFMNRYQLKHNDSVDTQFSVLHAPNDSGPHNDRAGSSEKEE